MTQVKIENVQELLNDEIHIIIDDETGTAQAYEILKGDYKGVRYAYLDIKLAPVKTGTNEEVLELSFSPLIFNSEEFPDLLEDEEFKNYIAGIYIKILENCAT